MHSTGKRRRQTARGGVEKTKYFLGYSDSWVHIRRGRSIGAIPRLIQSKKGNLNNSSGGGEPNILLVGLYERVACTILGARGNVGNSLVQ